MGCVCMYVCMCVYLNKIMCLYILTSLSNLSGSVLTFPYFLSLPFSYSDGDGSIQFFAQGYKNRKLGEKEMSCLKQQNVKVLKIFRLSN